MLWKNNPKTRMYIPKLTENKVIKSCIKSICGSSKEDMMEINRFNLFPENSFHVISTAVFGMYDNRTEIHKKWKEFEISHFINMSYVDSIEAKLKSDGSIYFTYARSENRTLNSFPDVADPFYLDSDRIDWDSFAMQLKLWCVEII